jgi:hypothetical protein
MQAKFAVILCAISRILIAPKFVKKAITNSCSGNIPNKFVSPEIPPVCQIIFLNGGILQSPEHEIGSLNSVTTQPSAIKQKFQN